jgi:cholesterol transport system auxiliary component
MKKIIRFTLATMAILGCALFGACATKSEPLSLYDLGPLRAASSGQTPTSGLPTLSIAEVNAPAWLDSPMMYFRLAYANDQQPRPYASSRWTMPPAQLFGQRLKSRLAQAGAVVLSAADGAANLPLLRIEADDFTQIFDSPGQSSAQIALRASVFNGRTLVAQKSFLQQTPAPSADAAGGAKALVTASDAVIVEMMGWLATLPLKK